MKQARVAVFEDSPDWQRLYETFLADDGHQVVASATSMPEARETIDALEPGDIDVALVDGNISPNARGAFEGDELANLLRIKLGNVTIIGVSNERDIVGADTNIIKTRTPRLINDFIGAMVTETQVEP